MQILKRLKPTVVMGAGVGVTIVILGTSVALSRLANHYSDGFSLNRMSAPADADTLIPDPSLASAVLPLVALPVEARSPQLAAIAAGDSDLLDAAHPSIRELDRQRARYLLATDLIAQGQAGSALPLLQGLEKDYQVMTPLVIYQQARAYTASGNGEMAQERWELLLEKFPDHPVAAEALYVLGQTNEQYWDEAIARFPTHPRSLLIAKTRLDESPAQPDLMRLLARRSLYVSDIVPILNRLATDYGSQLTPADWEAIGFGYWENQLYGAAARAYERASATPQNRYRAGRGAHLDGRRLDAIAAYKQTVAEFPDAEDTAQALLHLARLHDGEASLTYLDQVIERFPDRAGEALLARADVLEAMQSSTSAEQARTSVLSQYSDSEAAAELRWQRAEAAAEAGDLAKAWEWAGEVVTQNPDHELAPEAAFWVGKWAAQLGREADARKAFEHVLKQYPESYYAWRSASLLGWDVGTFTTARRKLPAVMIPMERSPLPIGSELLQELHRLGQNADAWAIWQVEFQNPARPTVAQQLTDGILRLGVGDHLRGIFMVDNLSWRPEEDGTLSAEVATELPAYWEALYPFPFIVPVQKWAEQRQLNPMMVMGLMRQESRFEPKIKSVAGATGLMQIMPATGQWIAQQTDISGYDLTDPDDNIKMGTWYLDYTHSEYGDNSLFAVASYNAGPGNVADWIRRFSTADPDEFVEQIPFPETKGYVEAVFENYWNYLRLYDPQVSEQLAQISPKHAQIHQGMQRQQLQEPI
ncbi:MAG: transglycosylase SLT domain-containing protein [Synechococcales bacterium]|nr:transglycosylase SLT domain-containing protein [Synechococcales bacterium]